MLTRLLLIILAVSGTSLGADIGDVAKSFSSPCSCPTGMAFDGEKIWVADRSADRIYALDPETGETLADLLSPSFWPTGLAFDGEQLWVADRSRSMGYRLDVRSGLVTRTVELDVARPEDLAWDGTHLWCVDGQKDRIVELDPEDGTALFSFASPSANPTGLAYDGRFLWVADRIDDALYRMDPSNGRAVMKLPSPGKYPNGLAAVPGGLWCADYQSDTLDRVSLEGTRKALVRGGRRERLSFTLDLFDFGPGRVETTDFYVAVPSEGDNQALLSEVTFEPQPMEIVEDAFGQKVAHFRFEGIEASGKARVIMHCDVELKDVLYLLFPEKVGTLSDIPGEVKERFLKDGVKYDLKNPYIVDTVRKVVGDEKNVLDAVLKIYDYVTSQIDYELVGGWNSAPAVLQRGTGSCSEYTFSFIALCRAAGIPAQYAGSLVVRGDDASFDDVFHRWAEVYLPNYGWIPFDPSRGDKKEPSERLKGIGWVADSLFITTRSGGGSEYLGWTYNGDVKWTSRGPCRVETEQIADWAPLPEEGK